jgi:hypothetical protein
MQTRRPGCKPGQLTSLVGVESCGKTPVPISSFYCRKLFEFIPGIVLQATIFAVVANRHVLANLEWLTAEYPTVIEKAPLVGNLRRICPTFHDKWMKTPGLAIGPILPQLSEGDATPQNRKRPRQNAVVFSLHRSYRAVS